MSSIEISESSSDSISRTTESSEETSSEEEVKTYLNKFPIIFYDLETTGLSSIDEDIIDISCLALKEDKNIEFQRYLNTEKEITNSFIHGITNEFLDNTVKNTNEEILEEFINFVNNHSNKKGVFLIAHNNFHFDKYFLESWFKRENKKIPDKWIFLDSLQHVKHMNYRFRSNSLANLYKGCFGRSIPDAHTSLGDVRALHLVYQELVCKKLSEVEYREMLSSNVDFTHVSAFHKDYLKQSVKMLSLHNNDIRKLKLASLSTLKDLLKCYDSDPDTFVQYLKNSVKLYSTWYCNKIKDHIEHLDYMID